MASNHTPTRGIRIGDELWFPLKSIAADHGETASAVVNRAIGLYVRSRGHDVDPITALERLAKLHAAGGITDEEWAAKRQELLARI